MLVTAVGNQQMIRKQLPFTGEEYQRRLTKTQTAMQAAGLELLFITDPSNMAWLTGYDGWSFYVHQGVILPVDADPVWWGRAQDANGALRQVWMLDDRVHSYADHYVQSTEQHPMQDLARRLLDCQSGAKRIGVELENYYYSAKAHQVLSDTLARLSPEASLEDATALVNWQRGIKSNAEIAFMRRAARISEKITDGLFERV